MFCLICFFNICPSSASPSSVIAKFLLNICFALFRFAIFGLVLSCLLLVLLNMDSRHVLPKSGFLYLALADYGQLRRIYSERGKYLFSQTVI